MSMPQCYKIYEYWKDRRITERGKVSFDEGRWVIDDEDSPACFACGKKVFPRVEFWDNWDGSTLDLWKHKKINSTLQRCHIVPRMLGGADTPENLFLLCPDCHAESPDTINRSAFFRWVYRKKKRCTFGLDVVQFVDDFRAEVEDRGYSFEQFMGCFREQSIPEFLDMIDDGIERAGFHGTQIAPSSMVVCVVDAMETRIRVPTSESREELNV